MNDPKNWSPELHELDMSPASAAFFNFIGKELMLVGALPPAEALAKRKILGQFLRLTIESLQLTQSGLDGMGEGAVRHAGSAGHKEIVDTITKERESSKPKLGGER